MPKDHGKHNRVYTSVSYTKRPVDQASTTRMLQELVGALVHAVRQDNLNSNNDNRQQNEDPVLISLNKDSIVTFNMDSILNPELRANLTALAQGLTAFTEAVSNRAKNKLWD